PLGRSTSRPRRRQPRAARGRLPQRPAPLPGAGRRVAPGLDLLLLHQPVDHPVVRHRRLGALRTQAGRAGLSSHAVRAGRDRRGAHATDGQLVPAAHREPRRTVRRAGWRGIRRRRGRRRAGRTAVASPDTPVKIGIVCYATIGGSGVVATELAHALAFRGHDIHLISAELPFRWRWGTPGLAFERVDTPSYPLFNEPQYVLALTNTLVRVSRRHQLDIIHAHYAVPHATAAYLAQRIL